MAQLNQKMQSRLDDWRKSVKDPIKKVVAAPEQRRGGKHDFGDVLTKEQWDREMLMSQTRR
jgi:hypothetical protein